MDIFLPFLEVRLQRGLALTKHPLVSLSLVLVALPQMPRHVLATLCSAADVAELGYVPIVNDYKCYEVGRPIPREFCPIFEPGCRGPGSAPTGLPRPTPALGVLRVTYLDLAGPLLLRTLMTILPSSFGMLFMVSINFLNYSAKSQ